MVGREGGEGEGALGVVDELEGGFAVHLDYAFFSEMDGIESQRHGTKWKVEGLDAFGGHELDIVISVLFECFTSVTTHNMRYGKHAKH